MRTFLQCLLLLFAGIGMRAENQSSSDDQLRVILTSTKSTYKLGEKIIFTVSVSNDSETPKAVLVRAWDWKDLEEMDRRYPQESADAIKLNKKPHPNIADTMRAEGRPFPLGILAIVPNESFKDHVQFDSQGLDCGTFLKVGLMPAHLSAQFEVTINPNIRWGSLGKYQFVWHVADPSYLHGSLEPQATSNVAEIEITK